MEERAEGGVDSGDLTLNLAQPLFGEALKQRCPPTASLDASKRLIKTHTLGSKLTGGR